MNIGIITYDYHHKKTEQVISNLLTKHITITVFALPFCIRPARATVFNHRPDQFKACHARDIAFKNNLDYVYCECDRKIPDGYDYYLITGSGILSPECVKNKKIINCHPGIIPSVRGLDAFKWAIFELLQVGNTLHFIDEDIDSGRIISRKKTLVFSEDTIDTFAARHYTEEIRMLSDFDLYLNGTIREHENFSDCEIQGIIHGRMPLNTEKNLQSAFEHYKQKYAVNG